MHSSSDASPPTLTADLWAAIVRRKLTEEGDTVQAWARLGLVCRAFREGLEGAASLMSMDLSADRRAAPQKCSIDGATDYMKPVRCCLAADSGEGPVQTKACIVSLRGTLGGSFPGNYHGGATGLASQHQAAAPETRVPSEGRRIHSTAGNGDAHDRCPVLAIRSSVPYDICAWHCPSRDLLSEDRSMGSRFLW